MRFRTNRCGGFLGGISNGEDIVVRIAVKPTPTLSLEQQTVDMNNLKEGKLEAITRRDITICPRIYPVAEAMVQIAITDALMMAKGYDSLAHLDDRWKAMGRPCMTCPG